MSDITDMEDKMDLWKFTPIPGATDQIVEAGQKVTIVRMVTVSYEMDIPAIMEGLDVSELSVKALIEDEIRNSSLTVESEYYGDLAIEDDTIIAVEIS